MDDRASPELQIARHFTILVYPFRHGLSSSDRVRALSRLEARWKPHWGRLDDKALEVGLDDTWFFLPYVRELFFPETAHLPDGDVRQQVAAARHLAESPLTKLAKRVPADAVLRLTYREGAFKAMRGLQLEYERKDRNGTVVENFTAPFEICWIDLALFPQSMGFLVLKVRMTEDRLSVRRLNDFLYYLRLVHPPKVGWQLASWTYADSEGRHPCKGADIVDFLLQDLWGQWTTRTAPTLDEFLGPTRNAASLQRYSMTKHGQVYGQVFHLYTYACLADPQPPAEPNESLNPTSPDAGRSSGCDPLFASDFDRALYELATCTDTSTPDYVPDRDYLDTLWDRNRIALWQNWQGMALRDNVLFLGAQDRGFALDALAHNVENDYFHLYLFTLFQKTRLSMMFGELIRRSAGLNRNLRDARKLWDAFMVFQNRYWFSEVTRKPLATEIYHRFQQGLEVLPLYEQIAEQLAHLRDYYEAKVDRAISSKLNFLAVLGTLLGVPGLVIALFSTPLVAEPSWTGFLGASAAMYAAIGTAWIGWRLWNAFSAR